MHDSKSSLASLNVNRLDDLINTISEARNSLTHWENKKTEALIRLDSFTYDIKMLEEEKLTTDRTIAAMKSELEAQVRIYQSHLGELTDQMQILKLENENLRNEILAKNLTAESYLREIENQKQIREQWMKQQTELQAHKEIQLKADLEVKSGQKQWELQMKNEGLAAQLLESTEKKTALEERNEKLERDLIQLRSHMMNALKVDDMQSARIQPTAKIKEPASDEKSSKKMSISDVQKLRPAMDEVTSVEEYLKRLGY